MPHEGERSALSGRRVLIVEDRYLVAEDLRQICERLGADVAAVVASAAAALPIAAGEPLDLAILDIDLGGHDVFDVATVLERRTVEFVFVTGYRAASLPERFRHRPLVRKPFSEACLVASIGPLLSPG